MVDYLSCHLHRFQRNIKVRKLQYILSFIKLLYESVVYLKRLINVNNPTLFVSQTSVCNKNIYLYVFYIKYEAVMVSLFRQDPLLYFPVGLMDSK